MRWFVADPTYAFLPFLNQIVPTHIPIISATPDDESGCAWDIQGDCTNDVECRGNKGKACGLFFGI